MARKPSTLEDAVTRLVETTFGYGELDQVTSDIIGACLMRAQIAIEQSDGDVNKYQQFAASHRPVLSSTPNGIDIGTFQASIHGAVVNYFYQNDAPNRPSAEELMNASDLTCQSQCSLLYPTNSAGYYNCLEICPPAGPGEQIISLQGKSPCK